MLDNCFNWKTTEKWVSKSGRVDQHCPRCTQHTGRGSHQRSHRLNEVGCSLGEVGWNHRAGERKEKQKQDTRPREGEAPRSSALPLLQSLLLLSAAFLIPASSSGASGVKPIRSNLGEAAESAPELSQHPVCREKGVGCSSPILLTPQNTPQGFHPLWKTPNSATQSTHQEGMTIFMLRVTGIRGLQRK